MELFRAIFYWASVLTWVQVVVRLISKRTVRGLENLPKKGGVIMASNHMSLADPPLIGFVTPRRIAWMGKQELFDAPGYGWLYHLYGCIPVRRGQADLRALRRAERAVKKGLILGMFPEGTRSRGRGLGPGEPGTALIAMRTGAPVIPVAVWGTEGFKIPGGFFRRTAVNIVYGEPFTLDAPKHITKEDVERGTETIMRRIAELLPERYRGAYSGPALPAGSLPQPVKPKASAR